MQRELGLLQEEGSSPIQQGPEKSKQTKRSVRKLSL